MQFLQGFSSLFSKKDSAVKSGKCSTDNIKADVKNSENSPGGNKKRQKHLKSYYKCTVNPAKMKAWNEKKRKQFKVKEWPTKGYMCPICNTAKTDAKHYLIKGTSMCEECALDSIGEKNGS